MNEFLKSLTDALGLIPTILLVAAVVIAVPFAIIWLIKLIKFIVRCCLKGRRTQRRADYFSKPMPEPRASAVRQAGDDGILIAANEAEELEQLNKEANEEIARIRAEEADVAAELAAQEAAAAAAAEEEAKKRIPARRTFELRLRTNKDQVKEFYNIIRNEYHSYGIRGRMGKRRENYKKKGVLYGRLTFRGRTLRLHLPLDPNAFDETVYRQQDFSEKKGFELIPFTLRLRTKRSVKQAQELIRDIMERNQLTLRPRFKPTDYVPLYPDEYTDFERKGYGYMLRVAETLEEVSTWDDRFAAKANNVEVIEDRKPQRLIKAVYSLDELSARFEAGSTVDLAALKEREMAPSNANYFAVTEGHLMDKPLFIVANEIAPNATKLVCVTGGQTTLKVYAEDVEKPRPFGFARKEETPGENAAPAEGEEVREIPAEGETVETAEAAAPAEGETAETAEAAAPAEGETAETAEPAAPAEGETAETAEAAAPAEDEAAAAAEPEATPSRVTSRSEEQN